MRMTSLLKTFHEQLFSWPRAWKWAPFFGLLGHGAPNLGGFYFAVLLSSWPEKHPRKTNPVFDRLGLTRESLTSFTPTLGFYFEAEGRVAALRAASRKSFGLSVQDINGRRPFISFRANGPKDHLRYRNMVRRTILLLRAYKGSIHGPFICDTMLFILE